MPDWRRIRLVEVRLAYWRGKYAWDKRKFDRYREEIIVSERMHHPKALAKAKAGVAKWGPIMGHAAQEVNRYIRALHELHPAPAPGSVAAKEAQLLREHPECHDGIRKVVARILVANPRMYITATTGGNHATHSYHWLGRAMDLGANDQTSKDRCGAWCNEHLVSSLTEGIHNPNLSVKFGERVSTSYWGEPTWAGHRDHVHVAV